MKKSINRWSFPKDMTLQECVALAKKTGYEAFEPVVAEQGDFTFEATAQQAREVKNIVQDAGLEMASLATGVYWAYPPSASDDVVREKACDFVRKQLFLAAEMGAPCILVVPGVVGPRSGAFTGNDYYDVAYDNALAAITALKKDAEAARVVLGIENVWNNFLVSPLETRDFIDRVDSPYVGMYFDVGNMLPWGFPEQWIRILGKRIARVHVKDFKKAVGNGSGFCDLLAGDVDWPAVIKELADIGYDGPLTAEMGGYKTHGRHIVARTSAALDVILGRMTDEEAFAWRI